MSSTGTLALVGLAKNTGKTETLAALLRELAGQGTRVGVTSVGRDGEERDVIDERIAKPRVSLAAGDLVASTGGLLRAGDLPHERLERTGVRTPLGEVAIARALAPGWVEVAGPSAAADVAAVSERMRELGAEKVLIDGAIDRRAASSPEIAEGLVLATGAVLDRTVERVVELTVRAVELVRLPVAEDLVGRLDAEQGAEGDEETGEETVELARDLVLGADPDRIGRLLREHPHADTLLVRGVLAEGFLEGLLAARSERAGRELRVVAWDPTHVFLARRGPSWYSAQGIHLSVLRGITLRAITVNPVAPESHRLDSGRLRELLGRAIAGVAVLDVLHSDYARASGS
ncbi:MAG TPA: hypothetical protein VL972_09225 [Solirubrobacteraceae bacterium]|nr:hypothetical protein [Solirubrobacteraceae bacterium]